MKVRAKEHGQYKGRFYEPGQIFEIENGTYPVYAVDDYSRPLMKDGKQVITEQRPHLEHWMEKLVEEEKPQGFTGRILHGSEK